MGECCRRMVRGEMPDDITRGILPAQLQNMPLGIEGSNSATYAGLDASWELDLFGKKSAKVREARGALEAQRGMLYSTWVSLSAEVAMNYITLRTLQAELDVTEKSIANMKENLSLMQVNQESGLVSSVPVDQLTYTLKETEAQIPELKSSIAGTMSKIAILTGTTPGALDAMLMTPKPLPDIDPTLYNAIPADVLRQRPDVYAAESAWAAQIAKTDEAKAEMKPKIPSWAYWGSQRLEQEDCSRRKPCFWHHAAGHIPALQWRGAQEKRERAVREGKRSKGKV